jgi:hypothetical protein
VKDGPWICAPCRLGAQTGSGQRDLWNALAISTIYDGVARAARDWLAAI